MLNQALNKGMSMDATIEKLGDTGSEALAKDKDLRDAVVTKILALVHTLPAIKQKLELMATLYPYFWVSQEVEWLRAAFGPETAEAWKVRLRKRTVPIVRREVRTIQGNLRSALAEIEAAARSIDALLSRDEVRKSFASRAGRYLPLAGQGISALAMIVMSHGAAGWQKMGSFLTLGVIKNVYEEMSLDAESVNQIGRAAETIFPWWNVFLRVLVATQFEFRPICGR